jgi:hypothetical protein
MQSIQQLQRSTGEDVEPVTAEVLVSAIFVEGHALVFPQRRLLDEVGHGSFVTLGADLESCSLCRPGWVSPRPPLAVGLGVVYGP